MDSAGRARCCWARAQLQIDLPLQVLVKHDAAASVFGGTRASRRESGSWYGAGQSVQIQRFGIRGGADTRPARSRWRTSPAGRLRARRNASKLARARRPGAPLAQKLHEQQLQEPQFQRADPLVFHERRGAQRFDLAPATAGDCAQRLRAPALPRNPPCPPYPGRGNSGRRCSSAGRGWC